MTDEENTLAAWSIIDTYNYKTVTIPRWLDILAHKEKVNYSHLLQDSLKTYLGVKESTAQHFRA